MRVRVSAQSWFVTLSMTHAQMTLSCYASTAGVGAPDLVAWYERQGFVRSDTFVVDIRGGWHGQVLQMTL